MTARALAEALQAKRVGSGWMACCPAHDDRDPSLSISGRGGRLLVHCHAGCPQEAVITELRARGLWPDGGPDSWLEWRPGVKYPAAWGSIITEYVYTDANGTALYSTFRLAPKSFRQGYAEGGAWRWKKHPQQVLYRLPEVLEAPIVFVVEGERDVETLRDWGFCATTNAGGARAPWLPQYTEALRGREVIIIPDMDPPGLKRACDIARALLGKAARIRMFGREDLAGCKDISEWFARGHSECELIAMLEGCHAV